MNEFVIAANKEYLEQVLKYVNGELQTAGFPQKQIIQVDIAVEEIFCNVAEYAYPLAEGMVVIRCTIEKKQHTKAMIEFVDSGTPYNPLEKEEPNTKLSTEERKVGGLGIYMAKKIMDSMEYHHEDGKNTLIIIKQIDGGYEV